MSGQLHQTEFVCTNCPYEVAVGNAIWGAFKRAIPDKCPRCDGELEEL